jgi:hypothetical protein
VWAVEGAEGAGRPLTQRLLADGERVPDVPAKLAARVRALDTGQGRKTDLLTELPTHRPRSEAHRVLSGLATGGPAERDRARSRAFACTTP